MRSMRGDSPFVPWWRSDWALGGAVGIAGATAVAVTAWWWKSRSADCSKVGPAGGSVGGFRYLERMRGGASPDEAVPMVVLFHSRSATPEGHAGMLGGIGKARIILPQGPLTGNQGGFQWWDRGVVSAMQPENVESSTQEWESMAEQVEPFLRQITICRPTIGLPIVTGSSQGGEMALLMASAAPKRVGGAIAVSSYLLPHFWNPHMSPSSMIHGTGDHTVPFSWAEEYARWMRAQDASIDFSAFASTGHAVTSSMGRAWIDAVKNRVSRVWDAND